MPRTLKSAIKVSEAESSIVDSQTTGSFLTFFQTKAKKNPRQALGLHHGTEKPSHQHDNPKHTPC